MTTITHSEIAATTAGKLGKEYTAESVGKVITEYGKSMLDLMNEKKPTSTKDMTIVQTPLVAYKINMVENGTRKNPDGTETKFGVHYTVQASLPNTILSGINSDVIKGLKDIATAIIGKKAA